MADPLKFWVIIRMCLPANVMGLRYQTSETEASTTVFVELVVAPAFGLSFGASPVANMVEVAALGVSESVLVTTAPGFKSPGL